MNVSPSFWRKVAYAAAIALMLPALFWLGQPAARMSSGVSPGGKLARMRAEYGLSQAQLGDIDPASETMRMATLGLRGVAVTMLWSKANRYKMTEDWDSLSATLNQIAKLQPNFISVWEFQAHNLSYNVSAEFDDYRHRYQWVKKGIEYLMEGIRYNRRDARLLWNLGWFFGHKIGIADEKKQFRRLFADDRDFHAELNAHIDVDAARGMNGKPDNWLVGYLWLRQSQRVDRIGVPITWLREDINTPGITERRRSPLIFNADPPMALINYAEAAEEDGYLDEKAQRAWMRAGREWRAFGDMRIPTSWGHDIRLNDFEREEAEVRRLRRQLDALVPGVRQQLRQERLKQLSEEERQAYLTPPEKRTPAQHALVYSILGRVSVGDQQVADRAPEDVKDRVRRILIQLEHHRTMARRIANYRQIVNYFYWSTRCNVEQTDTAINARKSLYEAERLFEQADLINAKKQYETAWENWAKIFQQYPALLHDVTARDLVEAINRYRKLLGQLDEPFPEDFVLQPLLDAQYAMLAPQHFEVMEASEAEPLGPKPE